MAQSFMRMEKKYVITQAQRDALVEHMGARVAPDVYGAYSIANLYYDTEDYELIRRSVERPVYKEKLRLRSYGRVQAGDNVYLELKRKYKGTVYKRRAAMPLSEALAFAAGETVGDSQMLRELCAFFDRYDVAPRAHISYNRQALAGVDEPDLRITFDENLRFRDTDLRLDSGLWGTDILPRGYIVMEIKVIGAMPFWLSRVLSELCIFPQSFSKYGSCYRQFIAPSHAIAEGVAVSA